MQAGQISAPLRERLGHDATLGLLDLVESTGDKWRQGVLTTSMDRFDRRLTEEIGALRQDMTREMGLMRSDWHQHLAEARVDIIKWSFVFWIGQLVAIAGVMAIMLRAGH